MRSQVMVLSDLFITTEHTEALRATQRKN